MLVDIPYYNKKCCTLPIHHCNNHLYFVMHQRYVVRPQCNYDILQHVTGHKTQTIYHIFKPGFSINNILIHLTYTLHF